MYLCVCKVKMCACLWDDYVYKSVCMCGCGRCVYLCSRMRLNVVAHSSCMSMCARSVCTSIWGTVCTDLHVSVQEESAAHLCTGVKESVPGMSVCALSVRGMCLPVLFGSPMPASHRGSTLQSVL